MLKIVIKKCGVIVKQLAIAFFFTAFFIFLTLTIAGNKISKTIRLINKIAIVESTDSRKNSNIKMNNEKKKLTEYPLYGEIWAKIEIPTSDIEANVYHGDNLELLKYGVGHHGGSYFPGEGGTIIIPGHNSSRDFQRLPLAKVGDKIIIKAVYGTYTYKIDSYEILEAKDFNKKLNINDKKEQLIVYTCYPVDTPGYKSKRYIVYASLVGDE